MKKITTILLCILIIFSLSSCKDKNNTETTESTEQGTTQLTVDTTEEKSTENVKLTEGLTAEEIVAALTLEQKAAQMVMAPVYSITPQDMEEYCYGSILSVPGNLSDTEWRTKVNGFQDKAIASESGIPYIYGQDHVHGVNFCKGAVIYPHNIGIGAANDVDLTYQMGLAVADEAKLCNMLWNFFPCVAQAEDPRWGRTYESYSSDLSLIKSLSSTYAKGLVDGGIVACGKHFFADGNVEYGTGEDSDVSRLIDRGDATLTDEEINELLDVYQELIDNGVQTIMLSHSGVNGVKMHENEKYISYLKNEMGFEGFIVGDWNSVNNITGDTYNEKIIKSINAGLDMLMQVDDYNQCIDIIIEAASNGDISEERINDAVTRIIKVKLSMNLFEDPLCNNIETAQSSVGSDAYRDLAEQLVEKSLVLVKNENNTLPLKENTKVYITGPAADNPKAQCGGWTGQWAGSDDLEGITTIEEGFIDVAAGKNIEVITDSDRADEADVVLLVIGEESYSEWLGDTEDLSITGALGLSANENAIEEANSLNKPIVTCIVAGRQVIIDEYADQWDSVVMCYLPGSEGQGVANVLTGDANFSGKLPMPWYNSVDQIGSDDNWLPIGFGLSY